MEEFFNTAELKAELHNEVENWYKTPYRHRKMKKQYGCDCIHFVIGAFLPFGILPVNIKTIPEYSRDRHIHNTHSLLVENFKKHKAFKDIYKSGDYELKDGDVLLFKVGNTIGHAGIFSRNLIYESVVKSGVRKLTFGNSSWHKRLKKIMRCYK